MVAAPPTFRNGSGRLSRVALKIGYGDPGVHMESWGRGPYADGPVLPVRLSNLRTVRVRQNRENADIAVRP